MLPVVEIVRIHTNPKRKRGNGLATSLALRVSVSRNRGQYSWNMAILCGIPIGIFLGYWKGTGGRAEAEKRARFQDGVQILYSPPTRKG